MIFILVLTATPARAGTLDATWIAPTTNTDGSALTDLASYRVYYGPTNTPCPGPTFQSVPSTTPSPGPNQTVTATLTGLTTGTLYFAAVTSVNTNGSESACSAVSAGVAARIDFTVSPAGTVNFGTVNIGSVVDQIFTIQNTAGGTVSGTVSAPAPFSVVSGGPFNLVGVGATATVTVRFTPIVAAFASANVTFTANGGSVSRSVTGTGAGTNPVPTLSSLSPSTATAGSAAFTLTVTGTNFVAGSVVQWNGSARTTTFVSTTQLQAAITAADIATAGNASVTVFSPAPGGGTSSAMTFTIAAAPNPAPALTSISPSNATAGGVGFSLTLTGSNFVASSVVRWNGSARTTTFVSSTQLQVAIAAADIATAGTASVTVFTPTPGGGTSTARTFTINAPNPVPTASSLSPNSAVAGGASFTLTVTGTSFVSSSLVQWNGSARTTTFVSSTQLTAAITTADIATAGSASVTVFSPTPGGGTSSALTFTITATPNPVPTLTSLAPSSATAGGAALTLTATGTNFVGGSVLQWNGTARTTTVVSSTQITATIPAGDTATPGTPSITIFSPSPGGGTSTARTFTVNAPAPSLSSLSPSSATVGGVAFTLTVTGSNFVTSSGVQWNGSARTTTFVSSTQLQAAIGAADIAAAGTASITVVTPTPGGGTSTARTFTINLLNPVPTAASLSPNSAVAGAAGFTLTVTGTNFTSGSVVQWNGGVRTTTFVSSTQLTAAITAADIATAGTAQVRVMTPAPGGGTSSVLTLIISAPNPVPVMSTLAPGSVTAGNAGFTLTVGGSGFVATSTVLWNGTSRPTTLVSSTQLNAAVTATDVLNAGTAAVTVTTPAPGGGSSVALPFVINPASTINLGLVTHLPFDQVNGATAPDASGNGNPGMLVNGPALTTGQVNQALSFNGAGAYVQVAHTSTLDAYPITVAAWFNTTAADGGIVNKYLAGSGNGWNVSLSGGSLCAWYYRDAANYVANTGACALSTPGFNDGRWHHVVYTVDAAGGRLYVDGAQRASVAWTGTTGATSTTQPVSVAFYPGSAGNQYLAGAIDDVRIYNRALNSPEVSQLYASGVVTTPGPAPVISGVTVSAITSSTATVTWATDRPSDTQIDSGFTSSYGQSTVLNPALVTSHAQVLSGLNPGRVYHFRVKSRDVSGNLAASTNSTFTTKDTPRATKKKRHKNWFDDLLDFFLR